MLENFKKISYELSLLNEWEEKYEYIIELGKKINIKKEEKINKNLITGCISKIWLISDYRNKTFYFRGDSNSIIMRGLLSIILIIFSGKSREEIIATDIKNILQTLDLKKHLSYNRNNGVLIITTKIKQHCKDYSHNKKNNDIYNTQ